MVYVNINIKIISVTLMKMGNTYIYKLWVIIINIVRD